LSAEVGEETAVGDEGNADIAIERDSFSVGVAGGKVPGTEEGLEGGRAVLVDDQGGAGACASQLCLEDLSQATDVE
jgi:hypothetical protein